MSTERAFEERSLEGGGALLWVEGKLRGWRARSLGDRLNDLCASGAERVVLDFTALRSMDSLGRSALEEALDRGLAIDVVLRNRDELDELFNFDHRGLRFYATIDAALRRATSRSGRTAAVAV